MTELLSVKKLGGGGYISLAYAYPQRRSGVTLSTGHYYTKDSTQEVSAQSVKK